MSDQSLIGTRWRERDNRFVRIVEIVSVGQRVGRKTVSMDGKPGHPTRVTFGDAHKFFRSFMQEPAQ